MKRVLRRGGERVELEEGDWVDYAARIAQLRDEGFEDLPDPDAVHKIYHASGVLASAGARGDGWVAHYDEDGVLVARGELRDGQRWGTWRFYHPGGGLRLLESYHGERSNARFFWENGQLQAEGDGLRRGADFERVGAWTHWAADGTLQQRAVYEGGLATVVEGECGTWVRGVDGPVRHGLFSDETGATSRWDLGARVGDGPLASADLEARLARVAPHDAPAFLRELFHAEAAAFGAYLDLVAAGRPEVPVPEVRMLDGCVRDDAAADLARVVYGLPGARARNLLRLFSDALGDALTAAVAAAYRPDQGRAAILRWLAEREAPADAFVAALDDKTKSVRELAARAIAARQDATGYWVRALSSRRAEARARGAEALRVMLATQRSPGGAAASLEIRAAVEKALVGERSASVRAALESALSVVPLGSAVSDADLDASLAARRGRVWPHATRLAFRSGEPLSEGALGWVGGALEKESRDVRDPELSAIRERLDAAACAALARELSLRQERWCLYARAVLGDDADMAALGRSLQDLVYLRSPAWAGHAVGVLRRNPRPSALRWIAFWSRKAGTKKLRRDAQEALDALVDELHLDADDLADLFLPTLGLDEHGRRPLGAGFHAALGPDGELELVHDDGGGDEPPRKIARNFAKLVSSLPGAREAALRQLELAMVLDRAWPVERWAVLFAGNPVLRGQLSELLVDAGGRCTADSVDFGSIRDRGDGQAVVRVVHPLDLTPAERACWAHLRPPFPQLDRPIVADPKAALIALLPRGERAQREGRVGHVARFDLHDNDVVVTGRPATAKILNEILSVCRSRVAPIVT